jgi:hypothetical protein
MVTMPSKPYITILAALPSRGLGLVFGYIAPRHVVGQHNGAALEISLGIYAARS